MGWLVRSSLSTTGWINAIPKSDFSSSDSFDSNEGTASGGPKLDDRFLPSWKLDDDEEDDDDDDDDDAGSKMRGSRGCLPLSDAVRGELLKMLSNGTLKEPLAAAHDFFDGGFLLRTYNK